MKRTIAIIVSLLFVLSVAGLSLAAEKETAPAPAKEEKKTHAAKGKHARGEVTAVDAAAKTLTVKGKKGEVTLSIDDKTKFHKGKTLADVKVGDKVTARYMETDGKMVASRVTVKPEATEESKEGKHIYGKVTAVDAAAKTLTVKGKKGEVTLSIDDKTKFHKGKTLADVKVDDKVTARYTETDGKMVASKIRMRIGHKKEKPQEEKK